ncbi:MAG: GTP-sensing pleiotropic transcriptional regulator CodY [Synergistaceae bacterium]|jgi:transcriptional pleiotropic repressor|nr:GTP-sensing pleiotropic transcriptional regulator CodY [Synergistaceae bacterium]
METPKELMEARPKIDSPAAMQDLLEKTRIVGRVLQSNKNVGAPDYPKLARLMSDLSVANVYVMSKDGTLLGYAWISEYNCSIMNDILLAESMPKSYVYKMNNIQESVLNYTDHGLCAYADQPCTYSNKNVLIVPINGSGERLGTLILARFGHQFDTRDLVLAEYLSTVFALEILNDRGRLIEKHSRELLVVQMAMKVLSYSEIESIRHLLKELGATEGVIVASKIADRVGVTRSVIVNALRKLGSAGILESSSLGMKGTYIKVINPLFLEELGVVFENKRRI